MAKQQLQVSRQPIMLRGVQYGVVGFESHDGDYLKITGRTALGTRETLYFPVTATPRLIALLKHAWKTKSRSNNNGGYKFSRLPWANTKFSRKLPNKNKA